MTSLFFTIAGPTDLSVKRSMTSSKNQLNTSEIATIKQLIAGYRESAAFLYRSADELEQLLLQHNWHPIYFDLDLDHPCYKATCWRFRYVSRSLYWSRFPCIFQQSTTTIHRASVMTAAKVHAVRLNVLPYELPLHDGVCDCVCRSRSSLDW